MKLIDYAFIASRITEFDIAKRVTQLFEIKIFPNRESILNLNLYKATHFSPALQTRHFADTFDTEISIFTRGKSNG